MLGTGQLSGRNSPSGNTVNSMGSTSGSGSASSRAIGIPVVGGGGTGMGARQGM